MLLRPPVALLLGLLVVAESTALPVRVLSRSRIEMDVQKRWDGLDVRGVLRDDREAPVPVAEVTLSVPGWGDAPTLTDAAGVFGFTIDAAGLETMLEHHGDRDVELVVHYGGDPGRGPARDAQKIDLSRETLTLQAVVTPPRLPRGEAPRVLAVLRRGLIPVPDLPLRATIGDQVTRAWTGPDGRAVFRGFEPPPPGRFEVEVEFEGNRRFNPTRVRREMTVIVRTQVSLTSVRARDPLTLEVEGQLRGGDEPMAGAVTLALDGTGYAWADADASGTFRATVDLVDAATRIGPRQSKLRAVYSPSESWEIGSVSPSVEVAVPAPPRVPLEVYLLPLLLLGVVVAGVSAFRSGALGRLKEALLARRGRPAPSPTPMPGRIAPPARRPMPSLPAGAVYGYVVDRSIGAPVPEATVSLNTSDGATHLKTQADGDGVFVFAEAPPGRWTLHVRARGFVETERPVTVPGNSEITVALAPLRALVASAWHRMTTRRAPDAVPGRHTPRQVAGMVLASEDSDDRRVRGALRAFEELYFGGNTRVTRQRCEEVVEAIEKLS